ncbi:carboxymuconolactone decarboxylase family protein [Ammonicoccus fulvus]|uniref:Carboxymuconolactone decarboxylase family protein n=1 Tax=Ammonicoccus fulvus TaxID=3138240 RepID=A0ABZ3FMF5_9ACTN
MARIPLDAPPTLLNRFARWCVRRTYGRDLQPAEAAMHNTRVATSYVVQEILVARWNRLDPNLKALAVMAAAQRLNCPWCLDFGFWEFYSKGTPVAKLEAVAGWRTSDIFSDDERAVMAYAEAMTGDIATEVTDDMVANLADRFGHEALVELTMMVAVENLRSRFNSALGLTPQGFKDLCPITRPA